MLIPLETTDQDESSEKVKPIKAPLVSLAALEKQQRDSFVSEFKENFNKNVNVTVNVINQSEITNFKLAGSGSFSHVYSGEYLGTPIALKRFTNGFSSASMKLFLDEVNVMTSLRHPNIVQLVSLFNLSLFYFLDWCYSGAIWNCYGILWQRRFSSHHCRRKN